MSDIEALRAAITAARGHDHQWAHMTGQNAVIDDTVRIGIATYLQVLASKGPVIIDGGEVFQAEKDVPGDMAIYYAAENEQ